MRRTSVVLFVASVVTMSLNAQAPLFRTETTVVQIPVRVQEANGSFVRDLTAADFEVLEDGAPQAITQFALVDVPAMAKTPSSLPATGVLTPAQLEQVEGRLYVFLLDDAHVGAAYSARARDLIRGFIRDRVAPIDAAAVIVTSGAARQDFTRDKAALLKAVDRFMGMGTIDAGAPAVMQESRARSILQLVTNLAKALGTVRGRHKTLIYVGSRVGCQVAFEATADFTDQILCGDQLWDAVRAAVEANVSVYAIDPRGLQNRGFISPTVDGRGGPDSARRRMAVTEPGGPSIFDGFFVLSDHTGGFAVTGTSNFRDPFDRIARESGTYYLIAYTSTNDRSDGKYRQTHITVKRPGVQASYRTGYFAPRP